MAIDDLPLGRGRTETRGPATPPPSASRWVVVGAIIVVMGAVLYFFWISRAQPQPATLSPTNATDDTVARRHRPAREPMDLPAVDLSDELVRGLVSALSSHPMVARLVATNGVVRNAVMAVEQIGDGKTPSTPLGPIRPDMRLTIGGGESGHVDTAAYDRWNAATNALTAIRADDAAKLYNNLQPLFDAAYRDLGHPGGNFDTAIVRAIQELKDTPEPATEPTLLRRPGYYEHADVALRALPPVQKQFLLVGATNRKRILAWLTQFADDLELKIS